MKSDLLHLVAVTSHPTTNELLVINSDLELSFIKLQDSNPILAPLVKLHLDSLAFRNDKISLFFAFGLIIGVVWCSGVMSLYDVNSGAEICKLEDLKGQNIHIWKCLHLVNSVGFWSINGIWKLQSGTVLETAECIRSSVNSSNFGTRNNDSSVSPQQSNKLLCTNDCSKNYFIADDSSLTTELDTTSENFLIPQIVKDQQTTERSPVGSKQSKHTGKGGFAGHLFAVSHLIKWNVNHRAAKLALDSIVCSRILSGSPVTHIEIPEAFLKLLVGAHAQGPAMALALLWEHPMHREFVLRKLEQYMSDLSVDKCQPKNTLLNELLHPYMSEFLLLSKQCKSAIDPSFKEMVQSPSLPTNSVEQEVPTLLEAFDCGPLEMASLERLSSLSHQHPHKVLECVAEYLKIDSKENDSPEGQWEQRLRKIYRFV